MQKETTSLSDIKAGNEAIITKVLGHGAFRKRITEMGFVKGIEIQRKTVMLTGKPRYDKAIPSDRNFIMRVAKFCCMTSLSIAMCIWIWFIWNL